LPEKGLCRRTNSQEKPLPDCRIAGVTALGGKVLLFRDPG
jgi:hypothetical protein